MHPRWLIPLSLLCTLGAACALFRGNGPPYEVERKCSKYWQDSVGIQKYALVPVDSLSAFYACDYTVFLRAFREPDLRTRAQTGPATYRLLWLPTFDPPVSVRVESHNASATVVVVMGSGAGGYEPGRIWRRDSFSITEGQWDQLLAASRAAHFWEMPTIGGHGGLDGSNWVIEAAEPGRYHLVDRWTPPEDSSYYALGMAILRISRLPLDSLRIY